MNSDPFFCSAIGLMDEHYNPINNRSLESYGKPTATTHILAGLNFKLMEGLTFNLKYQTESTFSRLYSGKSYKVRNMVK